MTTDESIMKDMLDRATNPANDIVDELGVQMFCIVVRSNAQLVPKAHKMIVDKVRSSNVTEATRAIALLEECMTKCGTDFQDETAKFRFLNVFTRLVSKNHESADTPLEVKRRIMECLLLWTTEFPQRQKIREVYDMLRKEGEIEHSATAEVMAKRESVLGTIDEAMFARLVKSKDPENFKRANLLLQCRMAQESRRNDLLSQFRCTLEEVENTIQLLNQMLDTYDPADKDVKETMHELYLRCKKNRPIFQHLPDVIGDADPSLIAGTQDANASLLALIARYKELVRSPTQPMNPTTTTTATSSITTTTTATPSITSTSGTGAGASTATTTTTTNTNSELLNELLGDLLLTNSDVTTKSNANADNRQSTQSIPKTDDVLADLTDIFNVALDANKQRQPFNSSDKLLEPQVIDTTSTNCGLGTNGGTVAEENKTLMASRKLPQIDMLSEQLFQEILPGAQERLASFKREPEKLTLNDLARQQTMTMTMVKPPTPSDPTSLLSTSQLETIDDPQLLCKTTEAEAKTETEREREKETLPAEPQPVAETPPPPPPSMATKHLSEIQIDLDSIMATGERCVVLDDDDMQLSLNFTEDRPARHVAVIVISAQNKSRQVVNDFQFEASVKKPCKVRLLPPTDRMMQPHKPFRPAAPVNQVMLLLNPTGQPVDVTCIVGYKLGDDPDPFKESIVAKNMPYVE